jgi:putative transposase
MGKENIGNTLTHYDFPTEHWRRIRTNNPMKRIMCEIRRRTRVIGVFPDGDSAINLVSARLRYIAGHKWSDNIYLNIQVAHEKLAA